VGGGKGGGKVVEEKEGGGGNLPEKRAKVKDIVSIHSNFKKGKKGA